MSLRFLTRPHIWSISLAGLALAGGFVFQSSAVADFPGCPNGNCPNCPVNSRFFGYYPTLWRRWPGTEPQPQPAPQPAPEQSQVPAVEPPPPADEFEKSKPMAESGGGAAAGSGTTPDSGKSAPADASGRRPMGVESDRGVLPPPTDQPKLNQLRPGRDDRLPAFGDSPQDSEPTTNPSARLWPPANMLRAGEMPANFQSPERTAAPAWPAAATNPQWSTPASPSKWASPQQQAKPAELLPLNGQPSPAQFGPQGAGLMNPPSRAKALSQAGTPLNGPPKSIIGSPYSSTAAPPSDRPTDGLATFTAQRAPAIGGGTPLADDFGVGSNSTAATSALPPASPKPLHWTNPPTSGAHSADQFIQATSARAADARPEPASQPEFETTAKRPRGAVPAEATCYGPKSELPSGASFARVPFVPSKSLTAPLAPVDPRALTDGRAPIGATPIDAPRTAIAPPSKVSQIMVPMIPSAYAKSQLPPAPLALKDNVTQIDPLAIGRSLAPVQPAWDAEPSHDRPASEHSLPGNTPSKLAVDRFNISDLPQAAPQSQVAPQSPGTLPAGKAKVRPAIIMATSGGNFPAHSANRSTGATASDADPTDGHVVPASFTGAEVSNQPAGKQATDGRQNPLRSSAATDAQSISSASIWKNPLR